MTASSRVNGGSRTTLCALNTTIRRNSGRTRRRPPSVGVKYRSRNSSGSLERASPSYSPVPAAARDSRCTSVANTLTGSVRPARRSRSATTIATVYASGPAAHPALQTRTSSPSSFLSISTPRAAENASHASGSRKNSVTPIKRSWYSRESSSGSSSSSST